MHNYCTVGEVQTLDSVLDVIKLKEIAAKGGYYSYVAGTAAVVLEEHSNSITKQNIKTTHTDHSGSRSHEVNHNDNDEVMNKGNMFKGIYIKNHLNTLPMGKGLSSSAAVCVLVAKCFNHVSTCKMRKPLSSYCLNRCHSSRKIQRNAKSV
jgi:mevalonate kinase